MALIRLGAKEITALTDVGNGVLCANHYEAARDEVLEANGGGNWHGWKDATMRDTLTPSATAPEYGYDYQYTLPAAPYCLKVISVEGNPPYKIEGRSLLTDQDTEIEITYIYRITDPTNISSWLARAIAMNLAAKLTYKLVQDRFFKNEIIQEAEATLIKAMGKDAMGSGNIAPSDDTDFSWVNR
jgi:hypothetical protein